MRVRLYIYNHALNSTILIMLNDKCTREMLAKAGSRLLGLLETLEPASNDAGHQMAPGRKEVEIA